MTCTLIKVQLSRVLVLFHYITCSLHSRYKQSTYHRTKDNILRPKSVLNMSDFMKSSTHWLFDCSRKSTLHRLFSFFFSQFKQQKHLSMCYWKHQTCFETSGIGNCTKNINKTSEFHHLQTTLFRLHTYTFIIHIFLFVTSVQFNVCLFRFKR